MMKSLKKWCKKTTLLFAFLGATEASAYEFEFFFGPSLSLLNVSTDFGDFQGTAEAAGQGEIMYYILPTFALRAHGGAGYQLEKQTLAYITAGGGVVWNFIGGGVMAAEDAERANIRVAPLGNLYTYFEVAQVSYDVTGFVPPPIQEKAGIRRKIDRVGTFVGSIFGFGYHTYINAFRLHNLGLRAQVNQSLNLDDLSISIFTVSMVYGLNF